MEIQICLGWELDLRHLLHRLPCHKFLAWCSNLKKIIGSRSVSFKALESLIGCLTNASYVIPLSRHFLECLCICLILCNNDTSVFNLTTAEIGDYIIWLKFLLLTRKGISMNLLTIKNLTCLCFSDSCPFSLGGWAWSGVAW